MPSIRDRNLQLILTAASEEFALHGFVAARVDDIAARAGLPRANVFYYFRNKRLLYTAVLDLVMEPLLRATRSLVPDAHPEQALPRYFKAKAEVARQHPGAVRVWLKEMLHGAQQLPGERAELLRLGARQTLACLAQWMERGLIVQAAPEHLLLFLWSTSLASFRFASAPGNSGKIKPSRAASQAQADMLLRALRPEPCSLDRTA
ncbi:MULTISPECIES: TetR family transcriptional regulator C-terminal domain-containing protein [unclassified Pseudomonas]|uniref:TetR family transcriptional regulator C-terminal domain-containing protein n=1 Tax=unclassified Pseudomonas TaxID=196821 RepID=UPI002446EB25|nr:MULTISPECIES: TetR family transcriptional regulator C-terminal domain-containing protein [unclassified Pseudomonas]MDH0300852.1 TetR family transcriptional regulator C-terminal domain-containing protein [Pseudomonas sp. GD04091]MDH1985239.1 TetR family transcriptional regulator C-terminal domain-containing protein [Pseudomonas sp. GD03689]